MTAVRIPNLPAADIIAGGDLIALFKQTMGDVRKSSITLLLNFMQENLVFPTGSYISQYSAPSTTGFSIPITDDKTNIHLILTPTLSLAEGTLIFPLASNVLDKQEVLVNCTQAITTLNISENGAISVTGAPITLAVNDFFRMKYDLPTMVWYRIG